MRALIALFVAAVAAVALVNAIEYTQPDVCVIGAGPAGLHMADLLKQKGKKVTVLEKQNRVGGRVVTTMVPEMNGNGEVGLNLGAVLLGSQEWRIATKYAKKFNFTLGYFLEEVAITIQPDGEPNANVMNLEESWGIKRTLAEIVVELYLAKRAKIPDIDEFHQMSERLLNYAENEDTSLLMPFRDYLKKHHPLTHGILESFFAPPLTMFGYGGFDECPALYALKYLYPDIAHGQLTSMTKPGSPERQALLDKYPYQWRFVDEKYGYETMFREIAKTLDDVRLQVDITSVKRPADGPVKILYKTATGAEKALTCGRLVLAFPPRSDRMNFIDLDQEELAVYNQVYTEPYYSAAVPVPGLFSQGEMRMYMTDAYSQLQLPKYPPIDGRVQANVHLTHSNYTQVLMLDALGSAPMTDAQIRDKIAAVYGRKAADETKVLLSHDYFPHVKAESTATFYRQLKALQGRRNTYYAGTLWAFDDAEFAMQGAKFINDNYF